MQHRGWAWLLAALLLVACAARPAPPPPAPSPPPPITGAAGRSPFQRQTIAGTLGGQEIGRVWSNGGRWLWAATDRALHQIDFAQESLTLREVWQAPAGSRITALAPGGLDRVLVQTQRGAGYDLLLVTPASGTAVSVSGDGKAGGALVVSPGGGRAAFVEQGSAGIMVVDLPGGKRRVVGPAGAQPFAFSPDARLLTYWVPRALMGEQRLSGNNPGYLVLADLTAGRADNLSDWYAALHNRGWDATGMYYMAEVRRNATAPTLTAIWSRLSGLVAELPGLWRWEARSPLTLISLREALAITLPDTQPHQAKPQQLAAAGISPDGHWWYDPILLRERHQLIVLDPVSGTQILEDIGWVRADWSPGSDRLVLEGERGQWAAFLLAP